MLGAPVGRQDRLFYEFCLEDRVPRDHLLRKIDGVIDLPGTSPETGVTTPDGTKLYVALSGTDEVAVIDARHRRLIKRIGGIGSDPWGAHMVGALNYCH